MARSDNPSRPEGSDATPAPQQDRAEAPGASGAPGTAPPAATPANGEADTSGPSAGGAASSDAVARLQRELADARDRLARARADYDNLQRRVTREAAMERERNKARVLEAFVPLLELAHMAAHQAEAHPSPVSEGVVLLAREFDRLVEREGLQRIGHVGEAVNPSRHEVLAQEAPAPGAQVQSGQVSRVIQPGYLLGDKVLRFAKVCVAP